MLSLVKHANSFITSKPYAEDFSTQGVKTKLVPLNSTLGTTNMMMRNDTMRKT